MSSSNRSTNWDLDLFATIDSIDRDGRSGDGACLSDFALDVLVAETSSAPAGSAKMPLHVESCSACHSRFDALVLAQREAAPTVARLLAAAQNAIVQGEDAADARKAPAEPTPWWQQFWSRASGRWTALPAAVAMAGAIAFVAWPAGEDAGRVATGNGPAVDVVRAKGTAVRFFVKRGDAVKLGKSGETFQAGDALRFVVTSGAPSNLLVFGVDSTGAVSAYHPFGGVQSEPLRVGAEIPLAGSLVLDEATETEFLGAIFSPDPVRLDSVQAAVQSLVTARGTTGTLDLEALQALNLAGAVHWIELRKEKLPSHTADDREEAK